MVFDGEVARFATADGLIGEFNIADAVQAISPLRIFLDVPRDEVGIVVKRFEGERVDKARRGLSVCLRSVQDAAPNPVFDGFGELLVERAVCARGRKERLLVARLDSWGDEGAFKTFGEIRVEL